MIVRFDKISGIIINIVNNEHFVQSDTNTHDIDVIFDANFDNTNYNAYIQFLRQGETKPSPKLVMTPKIITYNNETYKGYSFKVQTDWYTAIAGTLKATIEVKEYNDDGLQSNKAYGIINIPIEEAVDDNPQVVSTITDEEYLALINLINSKLNIVDEKVHLIEDTTMTNYDQFVAYCYSHSTTYNRNKIYFGVVSNEPTIGLIDTNDDVTIISSTGVITKINRDGIETNIKLNKVIIGNLKIENSFEHSGDFKAKNAKFTDVSFEGNVDSTKANFYVKNLQANDSETKVANKGYVDSQFVSAQSYTNQQILRHTQEILGGVSEAGDTLKELFDLIINNKEVLNVLKDAVTKTYEDKETTQIVQVLERAFDYSFSAEGIDSVSLSIPENVSQGYLSGFSIKIGEQKPTITFINGSSYPMLFTLNGMQRKQEQLFFKNKQTLVGGVMCDGINVYVYLKEIQQESELN